MADWKDYNIQDEPTASTPLNTVTAEYLNGMGNQVKKTSTDLIKLKFTKNYLGSFTNGWTGDVQYGKFGNVVLVHGMLAGGTNGQPALVLPEGYKPSLEVRQPTTGGNTLTIYLSGGCVITGSNSGGNYYFSLIYFI